jgi:AAA15 family ATPase/GTPase
MLKVDIKNFESVGSASFEVDGFTVVVGKNNIGKSAIIRAIDAALSNRTGSKFIRWGKTKCQVKLQKDALEIDWQKGDSATYKISSDGGVNRKDFSKLNKVIPQPILDAGFRKIDVGDDKLSPLVAHQFKELFLIDKDTMVTDVLSVIYQLNILSDADDLCQKDLRTTKNLLKTRQLDLTKVQKQLEIFKDFEVYKTEFEAIKVLDSKIKILQKDLSDVDSFIAELNQFQAAVNRYEKVSKIKIPSVGQFDKDLQKYQVLCAEEQSLGTLQAEVRNLGVVSGITIPETKGIEKTIEDHQWVLRTTLEMEAVSRAYKNLKAITTIKIPEYAQIEKTCDGFREVSDLSEKMKVTVSEVKSFSKISEISLEALGVFIQKIADQVDTWDQLNSLMCDFSGEVLTTREISAELTDTKMKLTKAQDTFSQYKVCPTCGKPL